MKVTKIIFVIALSIYICANYDISTLWDDTPREGTITFTVDGKTITRPIKFKSTFQELEQIEEDFPDQEIVFKCILFKKDENQKSFLERFLLSKK